MFSWFQPKKNCRSIFQKYEKNTSGLTLFLLQHAHMCHIFSRRRIIFPYICCKQIILFYKTKRPWAGECGKYDKPQLCPQP